MSEHFSEHYAYSFDEEMYYGNNLTYEECLAEAYQHLDEDFCHGQHYEVVYIGRVVPYKGVFIKDDYDYMIEDFQVNAYDVIGEASEDYLTEITHDQRQELIDFVNGWLSRMDKSNYYSIENKTVEIWPVETLREWNDS